MTIHHSSVEGAVNDSMSQESVLKKLKQVEIQLKDVQKLLEHGSEYKRVLHRFSVARRTLHSVSTPLIMNLISVEMKALKDGNGLQHVEVRETIKSLESLLPYRA